MVCKLADVSESRTNLRLMTKDETTLVKGALKEADGPFFTILFTREIVL